LGRPRQRRRNRGVHQDLRLIEAENPEGMANDRERWENAVVAARSLH